MSAGPALQRLRAAWPFFVAALLLAASGALQSAVWGRIARAQGEELMYFPSGLFVRQASLGYETAAADALWLRGIQYYGEHRLTDQKYVRIGHVMSVVTDLDPRFEAPYVFGAFVLGQELRRFDDGLALLEKGRRANPESWNLAFEIGFLHYVCRHDYAAAARAFVHASHLPGRPDYVDRFAAFASQRAGERDMAVLLWKRVLATGNKYMQEVARRELARLEPGGRIE
ncbi:MAG TPA: hypothetical protein VGQ14_07910 [Candidatus Eisenbacteria bacterium]|jgi:hypothetical protein|nr:hypothetical protein [Candidatus Eisenbacteria bacterium]